ncbi:uncharacterized protein FA14DRAFT_160684 [Meira miltonrushii]|uniref:F-box domain-containing protein n=1 Tax=Meira miltonrushii TaxID=1280837 RepID=A0A316VEY6_9BASI|nr:uncharacterized protein FA14DRAFT_160684 [Meira miltonrushii]PWN35618.1 hypothetical protein FA14DRAFT_160684 [Meira miltonrushii]
MNNIGQLPNEILVSIFKQLTPTDLSSVAQSNRSLRGVATASSLWEPYYLSFWQEEDSRKSQIRGTSNWRDAKRISFLYKTATRIWREDFERERERENDTHDSILEHAGTPFPKFLSTSSQEPANLNSPPDFYKLFCERMLIDGEVLKRIQAQCFRSFGWLQEMIDIYEQYGDDIKDILHALITVQRRSDPDSNLLINEAGIEQEFPSAYKLRLQGTKRSKTHHLTLLYFGKQLLQYIQHQQAVCGLNHMRGMSRSNEVTEGPFSWTRIRAVQASRINEASVSIAKVFENGLCYLSMFRGGEGYEIANELDMLAVACSLYLAKEGISLDTSGSRLYAQGICKFMQIRGYRGAREHKFHRLDNSFIHLCLDESGRESLPLTLVVVFCSLANRLGLNALPTNTPGRLLAVVQYLNHKFWISAADDGLLYELENLQVLFRMNSLSPDHAIVSASTPLELCLRASRNIFNGLHGAHLMADLDIGSETLALAEKGGENRVDQIFEETILADDNVFNPRRTFLHAEDRQSYLVSPLNYPAETSKRLKRQDDSEAYLATAGRYTDGDQSPETKAVLSMFAAANAMTELGDEADRNGTALSIVTAQHYLPSSILSIRSGLKRRTEAELSQLEKMRLAELETLANDLLARDRLGRSQKRRVAATDSEEDKNLLKIMHTVGTVFVHRVYGYQAVIQDWDVKCDKGEDWISAMDVDDLPNGGRKQPFYTSLVSDGSVRYVAHCNILPASAELPSSNRMQGQNELTHSQIEKLMYSHEFGDIFRCASANQDGSCLRMLLNAAGEHMYPDDLGL